MKKTAEEMFNLISGMVKAHWPEGGKAIDRQALSKELSELFNSYASQHKPVWIPVGQEKLTPGKDYLVFIESNTERRTAHPDNVGRWWYGNLQIFGVTHYMDLPAIPKKQPLPQQKD